MNRTPLSRNVRYTLTNVLSAVVILGYCSDLKAQKLPDDGWHFTATPYIWVPTFDGSMRVPQPPGYTGGNVDLGSDTGLDNLNFVAMGSFQAQKRKWSILNDAIYVNFSDPNRTADFPRVSGAPSIRAETGLKGFIYQGGAAYSIFQNSRMNFDILAGIRYLRLETKLALNLAGTVPPYVTSRSTTATDNAVDPVVGFKGAFQLSKNWSVPYHFDVGGFGLDSDLTTQASAGIHYSIRDWISLGFDYRYLQYDFGNEKMLVEDLTLSGPAIGVGFHF